MNCPLNDANLSHYLATEVMGWQYREPQFKRPAEYWIPDSGGWFEQMLKGNWRPTSAIGQTEQVLKKAYDVLGLHPEKLYDALQMVVHGKVLHRTGDDKVWPHHVISLLCATPRQKCEAVWLTWERMKAA